MSKYMIGAPKSKSHMKGWTKRALRERIYEDWYNSFKERTPTAEEILEKRAAIGFTNEVAVVLRRKRGA